MPLSLDHAIARMRFPLRRNELGSNSVEECSGRTRTPRKTTNERQKFIKKLLLIAVAISGLALVPAQRSDAQTETTVLVPRTMGLSFGFPSGYYGSPSYLNYYPYGYYRHPYVHYYSYAGNPYAYYSAPPNYRYSGNRTYHSHHRHHRYHRY